MNAPEIALLAGRLIFGGYFLHAGLNHFRHIAMMAGYAGAKGVPAPKLAVGATGLLLIAGALSILLGAFPLIGLGMIALFLIGVTPSMHAFWKIQDPMQRMGDRVNFLKNTALLGATIALVAVPEPWAYGVGF